MPVKTCFLSQTRANPGQREFVSPRAVAASLEAAGPSEGFFHPVTGKVKILPGTTQGSSWKMLGCSMCGFEQGNEAAGSVILPKSHKMQNFPESQVHSWLFLEMFPTLETLVIWMGRVRLGPV